MFCIKCGTENPENAKFCKKCGESLSSVQISSNNHIIKPSESIIKRISWKGIIIGFILLKLTDYLIGSYEFSFSMMAGYLIMLVIAGIIPGYIKGMPYKNGILNGYVIGLVFTIWISIPGMQEVLSGTSSFIEYIVISIIILMIFTPFGIFGGILGVFIKKRWKYDQKEESYGFR